MTNFERIKNMSAEEMVNSLILDCKCCICFEPWLEVCNCKLKCKEGIKKWLESEVEE